jgi:hypothetical protein
MLCDVHFVAIEMVHGKVIGRVRWMGIHGVVEMRRQEGSMVWMRHRGGGRIHDETLSG